MILQVGLSAPRHEEKGHQDEGPGRAYRDVSAVGEDICLPILGGNSPPSRYARQRDRDKQAACNKNQIAVSKHTIESRVKIQDWFLETM